MRYIGLIMSVLPQPCGSLVRGCGLTERNGQWQSKPSPPDAPSSGRSARDMLVDQQSGTLANCITWLCSHLVFLESSPAPPSTRNKRNKEQLGDGMFPWKQIIMKVSQVTKHRLGQQSEGLPPDW